ncbi:hypothetical protein CYMTET_35075, partial [Cymbomonas tetramitiformis]
ESVAPTTLMNTSTKWHSTQTKPDALLARLTYVLRFATSRVIYLERHAIVEHRRTWNFRRWWSPRSPQGRTREFIMILVVLLAILVALLVTVHLRPQPFAKLAGTLLPKVVFSVPTTRKMVALTIDDAPHPAVTPGILRVLAQFDVKATFFIIGHNAVQWPHLVDEIVKARHGYHAVLGSIYAHDPQVQSARIVSSLLKQQVHPGGIMILHDGELARKKTIRVLQSVLAYLRKQGYKVTTLSALMQHGDYAG